MSKKLFQLTRILFSEPYVAINKIKHLIYFLTYQLIELLIV